MNKAIILLSGCNVGKNAFNQVLREHGVYAWNISSWNMLSLVAKRFLGWNGKKTSEYYQFLDEFAALTNKYFNTQRNYILKLISKFNLDEKTQLLIVHGVGKGLANDLKKNQQNLFRIHVMNQDEDAPEVCDYLLLNDKYLVENTLNLVKQLTA